jgi:hypothetical protein
VALRRRDRERQGALEIAICGMGPVQIAYAEPDKPGWRKV